MPECGRNSFPSVQNHFLVEHVSILRSSYRSLGLGDLLADAPEDDRAVAHRLFDAPFALVSHDTAVDPIFNYGNRKALGLFAMDWDDFVALPSRLSAEPVNQAERDRLLGEVRDLGYIADYQGIRIAANGQRFLIERAVVWNLVSPQGDYYGQAAWFAKWRFL